MIDGVMTDLDRAGGDGKLAAKTLFTLHIVKFRAISMRQRVQGFGPSIFC